MTSPKITDLSVNNAKIGLDAVAAGKLADNAVISAKLADNAVIAAKIADNAVTETKIAPQSITKGKFVASGTATNTTTYTLNNSCTLDTTFAAPGVLPGDVVWFSIQDVAGVNGVIAVRPGEATVGNGLLRISVCEQSGVAANVTPGTLQLDWVAVR